MAPTFQLQQISGHPLAWAFAFAGDGFWIFLEQQDDGSTTVWHVRRSDGMLTQKANQTGRHIVGAGVSTCAPVVSIAEPGEDDGGPGEDNGDDDAG
jgi:hypothetical protein